MMKNFALAASITLIALSGQAFAATAKPNPQYWSATAGPSDRRQAAYAYDAFDPAMAAQIAEPNAYRYHGGPKYND